MVEPTAHDSLGECSTHSSLIALAFYLFIVRVLELVDRINLSLIDINRKRSSRFSDINYRGYSLTGKTTILHIVISGSSPDNSKKVREAQLVERNTEDV